MEIPILCPHILPIFKNIRKSIQERQKLALDEVENAWIADDYKSEMAKDLFDWLNHQSSEVKIVKASLTPAVGFDKGPPYQITRVSM
jgi:hypothetical protein